MKRLLQNLVGSFPTGCVNDGSFMSEMRVKFLRPPLSRLGTVDVFIHDSLHTYEHMMWELETAYPIVRCKGLLFADDALWNNTFQIFARKVNEPDARIIRGVGFLRKALE
jgi:hypothetical protein